ncbi:MAG: LysM domain-containing protein, partial [Deltaproteobacteria bacterium]
MPIRQTSGRIRFPFLTALLLSLVLSSCAPRGVYHRVERGQTLYRISKTYGVPVDVLIEENDIEDPFKIREGQLIFIPG